MTEADDLIEELRERLDAAAQSPLPRGPFPEDRQPQLEESTKDFLARVGPIPTDLGLSIDAASAPPGDWTKVLDNRQLAEVKLARIYARDFAHGTTGHNQLMLISQLADLLDQAEPVPPKPNPVLVQRHVLEVQYHSQHEFDAQMTRRDCGPACVEMVGEHLRPGVDHSTDEIMVRITGGVDRSTYISELQKAALEMFQVTLHREEHCTMTQLRDWILDDLPVIILVHYGSFYTRLDQNYKAGHYIVVVGFERVDYQGTPLRFLVHDPDFYQIRTNGETLSLLSQGAYIPVTEDYLKAMWSDAIKDRNPVRMALVPEVM